ncbi:MAG: type III pantothenate kinase [Deltaproteobacteria bacterium]|nr:type III pantothenate kinase [Deltaproteobacteria bacterium]
MLLAVDVGNTNTVLGVFEGERLRESWRVSTSAARTSDENAVLVRELFRLADIEPALDGAIISSVVPGAVPPLSAALSTRFGLDPLVVGPGLKTGMPILYENPKEVGADRIVNAVAAYERYQQGLVVVDFGTATTFDCVTPQGEYLGGVIAPGITVSADALYHHAAKLPRVEIRRPEQVVGRNTVASMQAGLYYGYAGLVDGIVRRMGEEVAYPLKVVATGGLAPLIADVSTCIDEADEGLTLQGLYILYQRNTVAHRVTRP